MASVLKLSAITEVVCKLEAAKVLVAVASDMRLDLKTPMLCIIIITTTIIKYNT